MKIQFPLRIELESVDCTHKYKKKKLGKLPSVSHFFKNSSYYRFKLSFTTTRP